MNQDRESQYQALTAMRKKCRLCKELSNPGEARLACFDSDHIGPWSQLHGDLNAKLMIVGQDWGDVDYYLKFKGRDDLKNPTMRNLETILNHVGLKLSITSYSDDNHGLFLTNAILCLKKGGLQAKLNRQWIYNCSRVFLRQQIEIVRPLAVVGLGAVAFQSILSTFEKPKVKLADAITDAKGIEILDGVRLFAAYHCGAGCINRNRGLQQQCSDWVRIGKFLNTQATDSPPTKP
jgi:uracil-DNA glycosylase